jgi:hypothetical protein
VLALSKFSTETRLKKAVGTVLAGRLARSDREEIAALFQK